MGGLRCLARILILACGSCSSSGGGSESGDYPRTQAGNVLEASDPLPLIPSTGPYWAVLDWSDRDSDSQEEDVLAVCHALIPWKISHDIVTDLDLADDYAAIAVGGVIKEGDVSAAEIDRLESFVQGGGVLLLSRPSDTALLSRFGFTDLGSTFGEELRPVECLVDSGDPVFTYIDHSDEVDWQLTLPSYSRTRSYDVTAPAESLATWESGGSAIVRRELGSGKVYVFGWRFRHLLVESEVAGITAGTSASDPVPYDADHFRLQIRGIHEALADDLDIDWAGRDFAPLGMQSALIVTHDVDSKKSYARIPEFVAWADARNFKATYLITTSPYSNGWVGEMYTDDSWNHVQVLLDAGHHLASHSFGHFIDFDLAGRGDGSETAANYRPLYESGSTSGFTVYGEVGVSRWLIREDIGVSVKSFRVGHLVVPEDLHEGLAETGYARDSSYGSWLVRGSLPYPLLTGEDATIEELPVMEYPLAISDGGLNENTISTVVDRWERLLRYNHANNVPTVWLVHNSSQGGKLESMAELLSRIDDIRAELWIGDWKTFAEHWEGQGVTCGHWR